MTTALRKCSNCNVKKAVTEFHDRFANICAICLVKEKLDQKTQVFECPCCHAELQFSVKLKVCGVSLYTKESQTKGGSKPVIPLTSQYTPAQLALLSQVHENGLMRVFEQCVEQIAQSKPASIDDLFLKFLQTAVEYRLPAFARGWMIKEYGSANLKFQQAYQIVAVIVDDKLRTFLPVPLIEGRHIRVGNTMTKTDADMGQFINWVKTRHGYVVGKGHLYEELKKHSAGSFAIS